MSSSKIIDKHGRIIDKNGRNKVIGLVIDKLHYEASLPGAHEAKTAKYWQYLFQKIIFTDNEYVVAAEQPPTANISDAKRVDIVVLKYTKSHVYPVVLFQEMKRSNEVSVSAVEDQIYNCCRDFLEFHGEPYVWAVSTLGTRYRVWLCQSGDKWPRVFYPLMGLPSVEDEYVESYSNGKLDLKVFEDIRDNPNTHLKVPVSPEPVSRKSSSRYTSRVDTSSVLPAAINYGSPASTLPSGLSPANTSSMPAETARIINSMKTPTCSTYNPDDYDELPPATDYASSEAETTIAYSDNGEGRITGGYEDEPMGSRERTEEGTQERIEETSGKEKGKEKEKDVGRKKPTDVYMDVNVRKEKHKFHSDVYSFKLDGVRINTVSDNWEKARDNNNRKVSTTKKLYNGQICRSQQRIPW